MGGVDRIGEARGPAGGLSSVRMGDGLGGALNSFNLTPLRASLEGSQQHLPG
jgi:hypothetical protein